MSLIERFTKAYDQLIAVGLSPRLVVLYGKLGFHAGADGKCYPTWKTLAREIGVKHRTTVYRLLSRLRDLGLIDWRRRGPHSNHYTVLTPDPAQLEKRLQKCNLKKLQSRNLKRLQECNPEKNQHQKKNLKESPTLTPPPPGEGTPRAKSQQEAANHGRERAAAGKQTVKADDDERKQAALSPEREFRQRLVERHGSHFDTDHCIRSVELQLQKCGGLSFTDFVAFDLARTTAANGLRNPVGHYVALAKKLRRETLRAAADAVYEPLHRAAGAAAPEPERDSRGLCVKCGGPGVLAGGGFCDACPIGRDLTLSARRKRKPDTKPGKEGTM